MAKGKSVSAWSAATTGAGAAVLATAATACCVPILAPLLVSVLGVSGSIWAARLEPYSLVVLLLAGSLLSYGFWTVYRPRLLRIASRFDQCSWIASRTPVKPK